MNNKLITKVSLLSVSLLLFSTVSIAPAVPHLLQFYRTFDPSLSQASAENLITLPALVITICVLLSDLVVRLIGKKGTVLLGLSLMLVAGCLPVFMTNFKLVLITRLILGAGIGLCNGLSVSMLSDFYSGSTLGSMIGIRTSVLNLGKTITTLIAGYIALINIRYVYWIYLLVIPIIILFALNVPAVDQGEKAKVEVHINKTVVLFAIATLVVGISYIGATAKIPFLLESKYHIPEARVTNLMTILAFSGVILGFIFGPILKRLGNYTYPTMLGCMALGNFFFLLPQNIVLFYVGTILIGLSFVGTMSFTFYYVAEHVPHTGVNFATSLLLALGNVGSILVPLVLTKWIGAITTNIFVAPFYVTTLAPLICGLVALIIFTRQKN